MSKRYSVILADPPWSYLECNFNWDKPNSDGELYDGSRSVTKHYSTMSLDDIKAMPVADLAADNAALFLWGVWPFIYETKEVIESWGFTYRAIAWVWAKLNPSSLGFHMGLGYYTRANTEPCLLGVRGSMPPAVKDVMALIVSPVRQHSRKPDEQYGKIERLYPDVPKVELFARRAWEGWDVWGNEVESTIEIKLE